MESNEIGLVCFDWGGVLLRICRSWEEGCERAGLPVRGETGDPGLLGRRRAVSQHYQRGEIDDVAFCTRIAELTGGAYSPEEIALIHDAWLIEEYPGVHELITRLAGLDHLATGLLSNTNQRHWVRHLPGRDNEPAEFPTPGLLEHRTASHLLGVAKPDETIFQLFERQTGFAGRSILFFDDLEENVAAARRAGWHAEQIDHDADTAGQIASHLTRRGLL